MDVQDTAGEPPSSAPSLPQRRENALLSNAERARFYAEFAKEQFEHVQSASDRLVGHAERVIATAGALAAFTAVFVPESELTALSVGDWRSLLLLGAFVLLGAALLLGVYSLRLRKQAGYPPVFDVQWAFSNAELDLVGLYKRIGDAMLEAAQFNKRLNESRASRLRWASITLLLALILTLVRIAVAGSIA
jgi:hypothetical protein